MMKRRRDPRSRRGVVLAEAAVVYPVLLLFLLGIVTLGLGVFRHEQVAALAREGARWASVHGPTYQKEHNKPALTSEDVKSTVIIPKMVGLDPSQLTCTLTMTSGMATMTLSYNWIPETLFSPITLSSTAKAPIMY